MTLRVMKVGLGKDRGTLSLGSGKEKFKVRGRWGAEDKLDQSYRVALRCGGENPGSFFPRKVVRKGFEGENTPPQSQKNERQQTA